MPTLRAVLTWLVLPLLLALLAPELMRMLPMLRDGLLYEWLRDLSWYHRVGLSLLIILCAALPLLKKLQQHLDVLAARSFLPFWRNHRPSNTRTPVPVNYRDSSWLVTVTSPGSTKEPPDITVRPDDSTTASRGQQRRLKRLLILAWYLHRANLPDNRSQA